MTRVVVAAGGAGWESAAIATIERRVDLTLVRRCVDVADLLAAVAAESTEIAVISPSLPGLDLDVVDRLRRSGVHAFAMEEGDGGSALRLQFDASITMEELTTREFGGAAGGEHAARGSGVLIAVWGPTGAPGRSSVALCVASALAARGIDTVLVDADVEGGAQAQAVGLLDDSSGLIAAVRQANQGHSEAALQHAVEVEPGLRLLTGLPRVDMADQLRPAAYDAVLTALTDRVEAVVVDCGFSLDAERRGRGEVTVATLRRADQLVVVGRSDPLGLARLVRGLHDLAAVVPDRTPHVLVNHARASLGWRRREVDATIGRLSGVFPHAHLPWDQAAWDASALTGRTPRDSSPSSPYVARVEAFAATLVAQHRQAT